MRTSTHLLPIIMVCVLAACSDPSSPSGAPIFSPVATHTQAPDEQPTSSPSDDLGFSHYTITTSDREEFASLLSEVTEYQRIILADGIVTFSEYERATFDTLRCMEEGGLTISHDAGFFTSGDGTSMSVDLGALTPGPRLTTEGIYEWIPAAADPSLFQTVGEPCITEYSRVVVFLWTQHLQPTEQEQQDYRDRLGECIRDNGYEIPEHPSEQDMLRLREEFGRDNPDPEWFTACEWRITAEGTNR